MYEIFVPLYCVAVQAKTYLAFSNKTSRIALSVLQDKSTHVRTLAVTCPGYGQVHVGVPPGGYLLLETYDTTVGVCVYS